MAELHYQTGFQCFVVYLNQTKDVLGVRVILTGIQSEDYC